MYWRLCLKFATFSAFLLCIMLGAGALLTQTTPTAPQPLHYRGAWSADVVVPSVDVSLRYFRAQRPMLGGVFVGSRIPDPERDTLTPSSNFPIRLPDQHQAKGVCLLATPDVKYQASFGRTPIRVLLVNAMDRTFEFDSLQGNLPLMQEARDEHGSWRPIEWFPDVNSSVLRWRVYLPAKHYWTLEGRRYAGEFPTQLRFTLELATGDRLVSNEFPGSISLEQFEQFSPASFD